MSQYMYRGNISSRFPSNSEAFASELLGNREEMFLLCWLSLVGYGYIYARPIRVKQC